MMNLYLLITFAFASSILDDRLDTQVDPDLIESPEQRTPTRDTTTNLAEDEPTATDLPELQSTDTPSADLATGAAAEEPTITTALEPANSAEESETDIWSGHFTVASATHRLFHRSFHFGNQFKQDGTVEYIRACNLIGTGIAMRFVEHPGDRVTKRKPEFRPSYLFCNGKFVTVRGTFGLRADSCENLLSRVNSADSIVRSSLVEKMCFIPPPIPQPKQRLEILTQIIGDAQLITERNLSYSPRTIPTIPALKSSLTVTSDSLLNKYTCTVSAYTETGLDDSMKAEIAFSDYRRSKMVLVETKYFCGGREAIVYEERRPRTEEPLDVDKECESYSTTENFVDILTMCTLRYSTGFHVTSIDKGFTAEIQSRHPSNNSYSMTVSQIRWSNWLPKLRAFAQAGHMEFTLSVRCNHVVVGFDELRKFPEVRRYLEFLTEIVNGSECGHSWLLHAAPDTTYALNLPDICESVQSSMYS